MKISRKGLALIAQFEGFSAIAYPDPGTHGAPWTIGYGHTKGVRPGQRISKVRALLLLALDVREAERAVRQVRPVVRRRGEFDALVSVVFNLGPGVLEKGTLGYFLRRGNHLRAADALLLYDHAGGHVMPGLTRRRKAERALFLS